MLTEPGETEVSCDAKDRLVRFGRGAFEYASARFSERRTSDNHFGIDGGHFLRWNRQLKCDGQSWPADLCVDGAAIDPHGHWEPGCPIFCGHLLPRWRRDYARWECRRQIPRNAQAGYCGIAKVEAWTLDLFLVDRYTDEDYRSVRHCSIDGGPSALEAIDRMLEWGREAEREVCR